jgi:hypothetical protein
MKKTTGKIKMLAALSVLTLTASTVLYGCGGSGDAKKTGTTASSAALAKSSQAAAVDVTKVADRLLNEIKYDDKLAEAEKESLDVIYPGLPKDKIKAMKIYVSSSGGTSEEIAAFEAGDEETAKEIETKLKERVEAQKTSFKNYVPEELKRLENALVIRKGNYVYLSVSGDSDKAKSIIEEN